MLLLVLACHPSSDPVPERCNGRDDDGDGAVDEGVAEDLLPTWYGDRDGDGFGTAVTAWHACDRPDGWVEVSGDCDDDDPAAHPGAAEACGGGDEDCDGVVDPEGAAGCVDGWVDADGDGLGAGDSTCTCVPTGAAIGGDCDDTDVDRQLDCSEGEEAPLDGVRIAADDADRYWSLLGAGALGVDGALALVSTEDTVAVVAIPDADAAQSDVTLVTLDAPTWTRPVLGDLDGDGILDLLTPDGDDGGDALIAAPVVTFGPLVTGGAGTWTATLDPVASAAAYESLFTADLDGDGAPEGWYVLGTGSTAGESAAWRISDGVATLAAFDEAAAGRRTLVTPLGDLDGDGIVDLGTWSSAGEAGTLAIATGPIGDTFPDEGDVELATPDLRDVVGVGDLDGDGRDDVAIVGTRVWILAGLPESGDAEALATARIGPESDAEDDSALFVARDTGPELVVTDTFWPHRDGAGNLRGARYRFEGPLSGVLDASAADTRTYGESYAALGAFPTPLDDGRLAVGAPVESTGVGVGAVWVMW